MPPTAAPRPRSTGRRKTAPGDDEPLSNSNCLERLREFQLKMHRGWSSSSSSRGSSGSWGGGGSPFANTYQHPVKHSEYQLPPVLHPGNGLCGKSFQADKITLFVNVSICSYKAVEII